MDLNDIPHVEGLGDASERHDIVMQLASEATDGEQLPPYMHVYCQHLL